MSERPWTPEQKRAINEKSTNLLVAAGAGSGKTAVLVERVISYLTQPENPLDIDRLLVVTFTNAAAAEMRQRISEALEQKLAQNPPNAAHLRKQLALLPRAAVSTLHSFCLDTVRQYFYHLDVDPRIRVANSMEVAMLEEDAMDAVFQRRYEMDDEELRLALTCFGNGPWDERLRQEINRISLYSRSMAQPEQWLKNLLLPYETGDTTPWLPYLLQQIRRELTEAASDLATASRLCQEPGGPSLYTSVIQQETIALEQGAACNSWEEIHWFLAGFQFASRLPALKKSEAVDSWKKDLVKRIRDDVKKTIREIKDAYFRLPLEQELTKITAMAPVVQALIHLTQDYQEELAKMKKARRLLDFSDMEHHCLALLKRNDGQVRAALRQQYLAVLVDEYQDINGVQEEIIQAIAPDGAFFMVGDVKQSIYRFRMADPTLFQNKYHAYGIEKGGLRIDLQKNFRSRPTLLHGINFLFQQLMTTEGAEIAYDETAKLLPGRQEENNSPIVLRILTTPEQEEDDVEEAIEAAEELQEAQKEARFIGSEIQRLYNEGREYRDMVILLRSTKNSAPIFQEELDAMGVPCHSAGSNTFFEAAEVTVMLSLLQVIDNPRQDIHLAAVLHSPIGGFSFQELAQLRLAESGDLYDALLASDLPKAISFRQALLQWQEPGRSNRISLLLGDLYQETGFFQLAGALPDGGQRQANLLYLLEQAKEYEKTSYRGLSRFLKFIQRYIDSGQGVENARTIGENENVVRILSIHQSKGLEFPVVFVAGLSLNFNMQDCYQDILLHRELGLGLRYLDWQQKIKYGSLIHAACAEKIYWELLAEELRVFYVALTRAKEELFLIGSCKNVPALLKRASSVLSYQEKALPGRLLAKGTNYLTWLIRALFRHPDGAPLRQRFSPEKDFQLTLLPMEGSFDIAFVHLPVEQKTPSEFAPQWLEKVADCQPLFPAAPTGSLAAAMAWQYPDLAASQTPIKWTVTSLQAKEREALAVNFPLNPIQPEARQNAMELGTVMHKLLETLDFSQKDYVMQLEMTLNHLVETGFCASELAQKVDLNMLVDFVTSPLGQRVAQASAVFRELPFTLRLSALEAGLPLSHEDILLQGIIDLAFCEEGQWVVVDYKFSHTHHIDDQEIRKRYGQQVRYYQKALAAIWHQPVKEGYVYFLPDHRAVSIPFVD